MEERTPQVPPYRHEVFSLEVPCTWGEHPAYVMLYVIAPFQPFGCTAERVVRGVQRRLAEKPPIPLDVDEP